jgi:hypothetical protein
VSRPVHAIAYDVADFLLRSKRSRMREAAMLLDMVNTATQVLGYAAIFLSMPRCREAANP